MEIQVHPDCQNERWYLLSLKNVFIVASDKPKWQNSCTGGQVLD